MPTFQNQQQINNPKACAAAPRKPASRPQLPRQLATSQAGKAQLDSEQLEMFHTTRGCSRAS